MTPQNGMELPLDIIPTPIPTICESEHERLAAFSDAHGEDHKLLLQPGITITRVPPCDHSHRSVPTSRSAETGAKSQKHLTRSPVAPSERIPARAPAPSNKLDPSHHKPIPISSNPTLISAKRPPLPTSYKPSTRRTVPPKHPSIPQKHLTYINREGMPSIPSTSSKPPSVTDHADKGQLGTSRIPSNSRYLNPPIVQKRPMSERAAETVRIMEWAKAHVKAAETRAREYERVACEERYSCCGCACGRRR